MCRILPFVFVLVPGLMLSETTALAGLDITKPGDTTIGVPDDGDWPVGEAPHFAIDDNGGTKYLHFKGDIGPTGLRVTPSRSQTIVVGLTFTTANDFPGRDPVVFEFYGSNESIYGPYELIASGEIVDFAGEAEWPRLTKNETPISFYNDIAYNHYQILFTALRGPIGGLIDSMQIAEIELLVTSLIAYNPIPDDGAVLEDTWVNLGWTPGDSAVSHDVYFGDNLDDVNNGTGDTFQGRQDSTQFVVGYQGFPFPDGLVPGTTYYWRVDEVEADMTTIHKGDIWSFDVEGPPPRAYDPNPADGAKFIDPNTTLSWKEGLGAASHDVYFGTSTPPAFIGNQTETSYYFGALEYSTTYYWQVNEIEADGTIHQGDVWSFTTARPDLILVLDDFDDYTDPAERWKPSGGATIGHDINEPAYTTLMETRIVHSGKQSMPLYYNNINSPFYSQADLPFSEPQNWTIGGANTLTVYVYGEPPRFRETDRDDVVLSGAGADIWSTSDEFRFVYKRLNGNGSITARVLSNGTGSNTWAKGGVMIRPGLDAGSTHGMMVLTGGAGGGAAFQWRRSANDGSQSVHNPIPPVSPPYWVRIERIHNKAKGYLSQDGVNWTQQGEKEDIEMWKPTVFVGLCVTSHARGELRTYDFANVQTTGNVYGQWQVEDIGVGQPSNDLARLYIAVKDEDGNVGVVYHPDPDAVLADDWQEWSIPLSEFSNAGVDLTAVETISLGVGDRNSSILGNNLELFATSPGESGGRVFWGGGVLLTKGAKVTKHILLKATVRDVCDGTPIGDANNARLSFGGGPFYTDSDGKYIPFTVGRDYDSIYAIADGFLIDYPRVWVYSDCPSRTFLLTPESSEPLECPIYCFRSSDSRYFYALDKYESESESYQWFRDRGEPVPSERDALLYNPEYEEPDEWTYVGIAFRAWDSNTPDPTRLKAVCRFARDGNSGQIAYAFTKEELDSETNLQWTCKDEEAFFAYPPYTGDQETNPEGTYPEGQEPDGTIPIYRFWSYSLQCHFFTISEDEISGWTCEGVAWYAYDRP